MVAMDTEKLVILLFMGFLTETIANNATNIPTTQTPAPAPTAEENINTTGATEDQTDDQGQDKRITLAPTNPIKDSKLTTEKPRPATSELPATTTQPQAKDSSPKPKDATTGSQNQTIIVPTTTTAKTDYKDVATEEPVTFSADKVTSKPQDVTKDTDTATASETDLNTTDVINSDAETTSVQPGTVYPDDWLHLFLRIHHFEGQYIYDGGKYLFDFVARNIHPSSSRTLVALFYDEDGAILEMNGTSADGSHITFKLNKVFTAGHRFPADMQFELTGSLIPSQHSTYYDGNITKPVNSSFETFHMNKGLGVVETGDAAGTRTAVIVIVPVSIAFLGIIGTVTVLCWASKKGMLKGRHRSYQLFQDTPVVFESEAETIHI